MLKSMTAYGRASRVFSVGHFVVELQSLNKKYLEIQSAIPAELLRFEVDVRKWIASKLERGRILIKIHVQYENMTPLRIELNTPLLKQLQTAWQEVAEILGSGKDAHKDLHLYKGEEALFIHRENLEDEELYREALKTTMDEALEALVAMREKEGMMLFDDISARLNSLEEHLNAIVGKNGGAVESYRIKLLDRLREYTKASEGQDERLLREICLFADKVDITEELTRFRSHLHHCHQLLGNSKQSAGKPLEFLLQELGREANTIGSKASDSGIAHEVVAIKSELEKIREQVQNVE